MVTITLNRETLQAFPPKSGRKQGCPLFPYQLSKVLEILARAILQETKGIQIGKEEVKVFMFANNMIIYVKDPENSTRKLPQLINIFSNSSWVQN